MSSCGLWPASASCTNDFLSAGSTTSSSTGEKRCEKGAPVSGKKNFYLPSTLATLR